MAGEEDRRQRRADHRAGAAEDGDAADHRGGDDGEFEVGRHGRLDDLQLRGEQNAGDAGEQAVQREDADDGALGIEAGGAGRLDVAADGVDGAAEIGVAHEQRGQDGQHDHEVDRRRNAEEAHLGDHEPGRHVGDPGARRWR